MPDVPPDPVITPAHVLDSIAAGLWPSLPSADRRARAIEALGLKPLAPWTEGRMVWVDAEAAA